MAAESLVDLRRATLVSPAGEESNKSLGANDEPPERKKRNCGVRRLPTATYHHDESGHRPPEVTAQAMALCPHYSSAGEQRDLVH